MTDRQRAAAFQLAAALRDAFPDSGFDERRFAENVLASAERDEAGPIAAGMAGRTSPRALPAVPPAEDPATEAPAAEAPGDGKPFRMPVTGPVSVVSGRTDPRPPTVPSARAAGQGSDR